VIRGSGLYGVAGSAGKGGNFIETMLRLGKENKPLKVVADQITTPTFTADLAKKIIELIHTERYGLYHISNTDSCSWHEFAAAIFERCGLQVDLSPTTSEAYGAAAQRPLYSVFAHEALHAAGIESPRAWQDALSDYLAQKGHIG
jgi:dTDP-4-dehydrorhamnose reductase